MPAGAKPKVLAPDDRTAVVLLNLGGRDDLVGGAGGQRPGDQGGAYEGAHPAAGDGAEEGEGVWHEHRDPESGCREQASDT